MRPDVNEKAGPSERAGDPDNGALGGDILDSSPIPDLASAEQAVTGACILAHVPTRRRVHEFMRNEDLADPSCRLIDDAMRRMDAAGLPVDPITLAGFIEEHRLTAGLSLRHIRSTIAAIVDAAPVAANAIYYGRLVVQASCRRTLLAVSVEIARLGSLAPMDDLECAVGDQGRRAMAAISRAVSVMNP